MITDTEIKARLKSGGRIIRRDLSNLRIKYMTLDEYSHGWSVLEKGFKSQAAVKDRMTELLKEENTIEI